MKRYALIFGIILTLFLGTQSLAAPPMVPYSYPFVGRWNPSEAPLLLDDYGLQDIQNMVRDGKRLKGVAGHTRVNLESASTEYAYPRSGFHFIKDNPRESHVLLQMDNSTGASSRIYQNTTTVPNRGPFSGTSLYQQDDTTADLGRFSAAPGGNVVYCDQVSSRIWGGTERTCNGFLLSYAGNANPADEWEKVWGFDQNTYSQVNGARTIYIGSNRRISGFKAYVRTANTAAVTTGVSEYSYPGMSWNAVAGLTDGTATGAATLAKTGTISWAYNDNVRSTFVEEHDDFKYWYQWQIEGVDAGTQIYCVTVVEDQFRGIEDIWDAVPVVVGRAWHLKVAAPTGVTEFSDWINVTNDGELTYYTPAAFVAADDRLYFGFPQKMRGLILDLRSNHYNDNASGVSVAYWSGDYWSGVTGLQDRTTNDAGTQTLRNSGFIHWLPSEEESADNLESQRNLYSADNLYYYRVRFDNNIDDVSFAYIAGIPAQPASFNAKTATDKYRFPLFYQGRTLLCAHQDAGNRIRYSAYEMADVYNGADSGDLYFGDSQALTAGGIIYNVFRTTGFEQLILCKGSETYRVFGDGPENWETQQISGNVGCVAPLSFAVCEVADVGSDVRRNIAIWQASHGFVLCDGATVQKISGDLDCYFDHADSRQISVHRIDETVAWYDPDKHAYHALVSSGAEVNDEWGGDDVWFDEPVEDWGVDWDNSVTTHNLELVYQLLYNEWTKVYREDASGALPLQVGFQVKDFDGKIHTYGAADNGIAYRLERGKTWDGQAGITQYIQTKDLLLDEQNKPFFNFSTVERFRLMFEPKMEAAESIAVTHYGDGALTVSGVTNQVVPSAAAMADSDGRNSQSCVLGPHMKHSFKFSATTTSVDDGMELLGFGVYYRPLETWRE